MLTVCLLSPLSLYLLKSNLFIFLDQTSQSSAAGMGRGTTSP